MRDHTRDRGERSSAKARWAVIAAAVGIVVSASAPASAQQPPPPPPPQPPPGFEGQPAQPQQQPPPGYGQPPPGYAPGGYYGAPPGAPIMGPRVLDWDEGEPLRPGYHADTRIRKGLVVGGAVTFGVMYLTTAFVAAVASDVGAGSSVAPLFVPAIGPFIAAGTFSHPGATGAFFLVLDGLTQCAGVAMFIAGIAAPRSVQVRNDIASTAPRKQAAKGFIAPVPMAFGANSGGLGLVGKF